MMRNSSVFLSLVSLTLVSIAACGGDSESFTTPSSGGSAGSGAGSGSGGSSGKGGAAGSGGSSAAGGTTGGTSGKGGSAGTGTGGTTGGASSGTGGEAGDATGGTGMAGTAGTGAMTGYDPPDTQVDACTSTCAAAAAAECPNADPEAQCVTDCRFAIQIEACSDYWDALFVCQEAADVECNADGEPAWPGCEDEYVAALDCVVNDALDPDLEAPCTGLCEAEQMITCDMSQAVANCTTDCQLLGTALPVCKTQLIGYLDCGAAADMFTCDADGDPQPAGCAGPALGFLACALTEYNVMP